MYLPPIGQHRLHNRTLELTDGRIEKASLFPFFDGEGKTNALMLTSLESSEILLADWRPELVERRWLRPLRLGLAQSDFADARDVLDDLRVDALWHFDPWWELGGERYFGREAVAPLRATNIPGHDASLTRFWFDPDLSRVTWVATGSGEEVRVGRYSPSRLRAAEKSREEAAGTVQAAPENRSEWRLRPFWS